uniref:Uncharacterized protein n=1 Tax=Candidatus Kentrum sp. FW TaxID=2126338 RepID=A0A450U0P4_9GAMM|nr:MAG: hypothetical protein BECKFW1821C_GA0114237_10894 [Candidatus Kentron sp. FW]
MAIRMGIRYQQNRKDCHCKKTMPVVYSTHPCIFKIIDPYQIQRLRDFYIAIFYFGIGDCISGSPQRFRFIQITFNHVVARRLQPLKGTDRVVRCFRDSIAYVSNSYDKITVKPKWGDMIEVRKTQIFTKWFDGLQDRRAKARMQARINSVEMGNFGDVAPRGRCK